MIKKRYFQIKYGEGKRLDRGNIQWKLFLVSMEVNQQC